MISNCWAGDAWDVFSWAIDAWGDTEVAALTVAPASCIASVASTDRAAVTQYAERAAAIAEDCR